jgi:hypothetical protein
MLKNYFIYKVAGKKSRSAILNLTMSSASQTPPLPVMGLDDCHKYSRGIDLMIVINTAEVST